MNNKEALKFAKEQTHIFGGTMKEFMNFIIPLLEEKPQGDIHDLISREALRNVILNDRKLDGANANWEVNRILVHIENAPAVDVDEITAFSSGYLLGKLVEERPQGEWKVNGCLIACNKCGRILLKASELYNFCPNCGADMRGAV